MRIVITNTNLVISSKDWSEYVFDKNNVKHYSINTAYQWTSGTIGGGRLAFCIPINGSQQVKITTGLKSCRYAFTYVEPTDFNPTEEIVTGGDIPANTTQTIDVSSGAKYIIVNAMNSGGYGEDRWNYPDKLLYR